MAVQNVKELEVYKKSYQQAMNFFEVSKRFPAEERYALIGKMIGAMIRNPEKFLLTPDS